LTGFYDKARKKLQQAEMTSDLATEADEETPKKRLVIIDSSQFLKL
jgi:hypothetical protein